jgi:glutathione S-transferase
MSTYRLHYSPGACSFAVHALLEEIGAPFELVERNIRAGGTKSEAYRHINPKARVPALEHDGEVLTEAPAILVYLAERHPEAGLIGPAGSLARCRALEWLNYLSSTLHPLYWGVWRAHRLSADATHHAAIAETVTRDLAERYAGIDQHLARNEYTAGEAMSVADFLQYVFTRWAWRIALPVESWPHLHAHFERMDAWPAVRRAFATERLDPVGSVPRATA